MSLSAGQNMAPGERVVRCLQGRPIDRVPFGVGIGWFPWGQTLERWRSETGDASLDPGVTLGYDRSFASPTVHAGFLPAFEPEVLEARDGFVIHRDPLGIIKRDRADGLSMPEFLEHPVRGPADWLKLKDERLDPETPGRLAEDLAAFASRVHQTGEAVQVGAFPYGVFGTPRDLLGVERLLTSFYDEPEMVADMMQHLTGLWLSVWDRIADETPIDHIHIWEDMSGRQGSLISPRMVERFMMPCYDRIAEFARSRNVPIVSVDTDGDCSRLVPIFMRHGINMMFPFEVQAGNDIRKVRRDYPRLGIIGGLDKRVETLTGPAGAAQVQLARDMAAAGRYVPGFDHLIPPDVPWDAFRDIAEAIRDVCLTTKPNPTAAAT
jgi:uroporphyrinogen decarboxylase